MQRMEKLFPGYRVRSQGLFRITRNTDGEIEEDEADDLARGRARLRRAAPLRLHRAPRARAPHAQCLQDFLVKHLGTRPYQVFKSRMPLAFSEFMGLGGIDRPALKYPPFHPTLPEALEPETDTFAAIRKRDLMFYHPYETFGGVLNFLQKAGDRSERRRHQADALPRGSDSPVVRSPP